MHAFKVMVICSPLFTYDRQDHWNCMEKEGGLLHKWLHSVFRLGKAVEDSAFLLELGPNRQLLKKHLDYGDTAAQRRLVTERHYCWPNLSIDLSLNSVSATCWGGWTWQMLQTVTEERCHWNHIQITSNGVTDDYCVHKCFTLGLSWLWVHKHNWRSWISHYSLNE